MSQSTIGIVKCILINLLCYVKPITHLHLKVQPTSETDTQPGKAERGGMKKIGKKIQIMFFFLSNTFPQSVIGP